MFITNIREIGDENLFKCNKEDAFYLQSNGFPLIGIDKTKYCFYKTEELLAFLKSKGGGI